MLDEARARSPHDLGLPSFVEREFRDYLGCGVLARDFVRIRCESCGDEHLVEFSRKRRGVRPSPSPYRLDWAAELKRVYVVNVLKCARCGGRLEVLAFIEKLTAVRAILDHLGLPSASLPLGKARRQPQVAWGF